LGDNNLKKWMMIVLSFCLAVSITACSHRGDIKKTVSSELTANSTHTSSESIASPNSNDSTDKLDKYGLPVMSGEYQKIYDKYFMSDCAAIYNFQSNFDKTHIEHFLPEETYSHLVNQQQDAYVPKDEVETLLMKYFPFSSEMIHTYANKYFDNEKQEYSIWTLHPSNSSEQSICGAVVSSMLDRDRLTVDCVWNWSSYPDNPGSFESYATSTTIIIIRSDTEWFYESNKVIKNTP